jgi:hypothetical protein
MGNDDLDMSWIHEYSRIHSIQQIMNREELDTITFQTIYINTNLEIIKIDEESIELEKKNKKCYISKEKILKIIQEKKITELKKYKVFDILLFTVDLDPKDIQKYVNGECNEIAKLNSIPIPTITDVYIAPSLFIFHSLHTFILFFLEISVPPTTSIKSIMKPSGSGNENTNGNKQYKQTKKVRIIENENEIIAHKASKKTRKVWCG